MAKSKLSNINQTTDDKPTDGQPSTYVPLPGDNETAEKANEMAAALPAEDKRWFGARIVSKYNGSFLFALGFQYFNTGMYSMVSMAMNYMFLNVYGISPSQATFYITLTNLPWSPKIIYGIVTDCLPICGSGKRSYVFIMGMF